MSVEENLNVVETVDKAFNNRDWDAFNECHSENVISYSVRATEPTRGIKAHRESMLGLLGAFPDF